MARMAMSASAVATRNALAEVVMRSRSKDAITPGLVRACRRS